MMNFIDLKTPYQKHKKAIDAAIQKVLDHGQYILGPEVKELESQLASFVGVKHALTVSSGTDALLLALMVLDVKPGDEVITTPFSFFATGEMVALLGATPVFVDIDPQTFNIDPTLIESAITEKTKCILPVSLYGQCADLSAINAIAAKHQLPVIEDAAQSFGAEHHGKKSCGLTTIATTSFFPAKAFGCFGDGGACFTNDDAIAEKLRILFNHGQSSRYHHQAIGINGRFDTIQAAVLLEKFKFYSEEIELRQQAAKTYDEILAEKVKTPYIASENKSVYAQYTVLVEDREKVQQGLQAKGIPTAVHYPATIPDQPAFAKYQTNQRLSHARDAATKVLSLPMHPYLLSEDCQRVAQSLLEVLG